MDANKINMIEKFKNAFSKPESKMSISSTQNEDKIEIKNNTSSGLNAKKILTAAWAALAVTSVSATVLTVPDFVQRSNTLTKLLQSGKVDAEEKMIDNIFYREHGVNLKDSFKAGLEKLSHGYMKNDEINDSFENSLLKKEVKIISKADLITKIDELPSVADIKNDKNNTLK